MRKLYVALIVAVVILFGIYCFIGFEIQTVSTDKKIYSPGEEVKINWSYFSFLQYNSCSGTRAAIFRESRTGWESVPYELFARGRNQNIACVNGDTVFLGMPSDIIMCSNSGSGNLSWNSKLYERNGTTDSCSVCVQWEKKSTVYSCSKHNVLNSTIENYDLKNAPIGKYKIMVGTAQEIIEIQ